MNIPEKLLKLPNKELSKVLTPNKYKAKYFHSEYSIIELVANVKNTVLFNVEGEEIDSKYRVHFFEDYTPVTVEYLNKIKLNNIIESLNTAKPNVILKYLNIYVNKIIDKQYYDITTNTDNTKYYLIIHYPEIKIVNSVEQEHIIRDVFLKLTFYSQNGIWVDKIDMARTTYTLEEWNKDYMFSHISASSLSGYESSFCYGNDTIISQTLQKFRKTINITKLAEFLMMFREYLGWESLEGVPYKYIDKLLKSEAFEPTNLSVSKNSELVIECIKTVYKKLSTFKYTYSITNNRYFIQLEQESIDEIDIVLTSSTDEANLYYLVNKQSCISKQYNSTKTTFNSVVIFKGVKQEGKIILPIVDYNTYEKRIHRDVLDTVVNAIIEEFEEFLFNKTNNYE